MDDIPEEGTKNIKKDYIVKIAFLLNECNDLKLLDLIFKLLRKSI